MTTRYAMMPDDALIGLASILMNSNSWTSRLSRDYQLQASIYGVFLSNVPILGIGVSLDSLASLPPLFESNLTIPLPRSPLELIRVSSDIMLLPGIVTAHTPSKP